MSYEVDLVDNNELAPRAVLRAAPHTSFGLIDGRPIIFSEKESGDIRIK